MLLTNNRACEKLAGQARGIVLRDCVRRSGLRRGAIALAASLLLSACAAPDATQPTSKFSDVFATPEWARGNQARQTAQRAVTQNDLINPDGSCALPSEAAAATDGVAPASPDANGAPAGQGALPVLQGGVALGMTECQVVLRTGAPDTFNIGAEGADRVATVTVMRGSWPGLYRFRGGRLVSIERVEVPAPPKPVRQTRQKKTATKSQGVPLRGAQQ